LNPPPRLMLGDCLERMSEIENASVDLIAADLPYGTTRSGWDSVIPLDLLWRQYDRVLKKNGAVVLTAAMPFTAVLAASNLSWLKYDLIWAKNRATGHLNAQKSPLRAHESILVFSPGTPVYNPLKTIGHKAVNRFYTRSSGDCFGPATRLLSGGGQTDRFPTSILPFPVVSNIGSGRIHPNQKPIELFDWIVRTYSNAGDTVLDNCMGSGTTAVACIKAGRGFIGIESRRTYFDAARERIEAATNQPVSPGGFSYAQEAAK
jgi:site-specific DNA-methyltransferase (adenine-specific)